MALQIRSLTICLLDSNLRFHSSSWGKRAHLACCPPLHFLLDETPAAASPPLHFIRQPLLFTTLDPSFCAQVALTKSIFTVALHLCILHSESASNPLHFPHMASLSPALCLDRVINEVLKSKSLLHTSVCSMSKHLSLAKFRGVFLGLPGRCARWPTRCEVRAFLSCCRGQWGSLIWKEQCVFP